MEQNTIDALRRESARHKKLAKQMDDLIAEMERFTNGVATHETRPKPTIQEAISPIASNRFLGVKQADAIEKVLRDHGELHLKEIYDHLARGGIKLPRLGYVSVLLSRGKDRFVTTGNGRWSLKERALL